jgi:hypothetical protein
MFYYVVMNERRTNLTPITGGRASICPNCGGVTDRPYLDCSVCRAKRWRMTSEERRATWASFPGLDAAEPISLDEERTKRRRRRPDSDAVPAEDDQAAS